MSAQDLDPRAISDLARSGLTTLDINAEPQTPKTSFHGEASPGYVIPYYDRVGNRLERMYRVKLYEPAKGRKYDQPGAAEIGPEECRKPYFAPPHICTYTAPIPRLLIVEGEKKTLAAIKYLGIKAIGIGGCENWHGFQTEAEEESFKAKELMKEIREVAEGVPLVEAVFDADIATNPHVRRGAMRLWWACHRAGITLKFVLLPEETKGLDDWIMAQADGTAPAAFETLPRITLETWDVGREARSEMFAAIGVEHHKLKCEVNERVVKHIFHTHPRFKNRLYVDMVKHRIMLDDKPMHDSTGMNLLCDFQDFMPTLGYGMFYGSMTQIAWERPINPITKWLDGLVWDGVPRLETFAERYFKLIPTPYLKRVFQNYLTAAVARMYVPGTKFDHLLVLQGAQGIGKTRMLIALFGKDYACVAPHTTAIGSRDWLDAGGNGWCLILDELAGLSRMEHTELKTALSTESDTYRRAYRKDPETFPRMFVCAATTNEDVYLTDPTGNRRYWPIPCTQVDVAALEADREQVWAEAVALYRSGFAFWELPPEADTEAREHQEDAHVPDPSEERVAELFVRARAVHESKRPPVVDYGGRPCYFVGSMELMVAVAGEDHAFAKNAALAKRVRSAALRFPGWQGANVYDNNGIKRRGYVYDKELADSEPRAEEIDQDWLTLFGRNGAKF